MSTTAHAATAIRPFQVDIRDTTLEDLRRRLASTRLPSRELVADRSQGVQLETIKRSSATGRTSTTCTGARRG